ncbi:hypothetical protein BpHYR1_051148 [Brachionus plicatilis]|uniref:Uncharacterized protein n=1 Tax=Brachionus plicatilis TaxID=10195 RepID=A0A3M7SUU8_BRAPC|nr:hypothetical protein BpHYR1_051148 [Brachionus plicatilis]
MYFMHFIPYQPIILYDVFSDENIFQLIIDVQIQTKIQQGQLMKFCNLIIFSHYLFWSGESNESEADLFKHSVCTSVCSTLMSSLLDSDIERSEVLRMEFLFIPICSCQEHELIINSRCELSA